MAKVICTLKNASLNINGIRFVEHAQGVISEEISDETAAIFASIKGYRIAGAKTKGTSDETAPAGAKGKGKAAGDAPAGEVPAAGEAGNEVDEGNSAEDQSGAADETAGTASASE